LIPKALAIMQAVAKEHFWSQQNKFRRRCDEMVRRV